MFTDYLSCECLVKLFRLLHFRLSTSKTFLLVFQACHSDYACRFEGKSFIPYDGCVAAETRSSL
jgi:hypothetical protein